MKIPVDKIDRVSKTLMKVLPSTSEKWPLDCELHARLGQVLLQDPEMETVLRMGSAAWRVGPEDGAVVHHAKAKAPPNLPESELKQFSHIWLELEPEKLILDFTIYQLAAKLKILDELDGQTSTCGWHGKYLLAPYTLNSTIEDVVQGYNLVWLYERDRALEDEFLPEMEIHPIGESVNIAKLVLQNPQVEFHGIYNAEERLG